MSDPTSGRPDPDAGSLSEGVASSLSELERKLRLLEDELAAVASPGPAPPSAAPDEPIVAWEPAAGAPAWEAGEVGEGGVDWRSAPGDWGEPPAPAPAQERAPRTDAEARPRTPRGGEGFAVPQGDLELLLRFRDQLERYSRALVTDYGRLLGHLGIDVSPPPPWTGPDGGATAALPEEPNEYHGRGAAHEDIVFEGSVALEAGPVRGVGELRELERHAASLPGAGVQVRAFEGGRAVLDLQLAHPTSLVAELRRVLEREFLVLDAGPGRLSIVLGGPTHDG